jgi:hypothetical protein
MVVDLPQLVFTYIARKAAKQEWNSKKKKKGWPGKVSLSREQQRVPVL